LFEFCGWSNLQRNATKNQTIYVFPKLRHSPQFKIQICSDIRSGKIGRRETLKTHNLSANLMQMWLRQFDHGELNAEDAVASTVAEYEAHIAALERKVGQLTMELDLLN
jgi:transposase-like protein